MKPDSGRIGPVWCESKKKKKKKKIRRGTDARAAVSVATPRVGLRQTPVRHPPSRVGAS